MQLDAVDETEAIADDQRLKEQQVEVVEESGSEMKRQLLAAVTEYVMLHLGGRKYRSKRLEVLPSEESGSSEGHADDNDEESATDTPVEDVMVRASELVTPATAAVVDSFEIDRTGQETEVSV